MFWRAVAIIVFVLAFVQLIFIDREFSVADNGDFARYNSFCKKPCDLESNEPPKPEERPRRFYTFPHMYWDLAEAPGERWFSSANIVWACGKAINTCFFSPRIFSLRNAGILFFFIHAIALLIFLVSVYKKKNWLCVIIPVLLFSIDANFTQFYNTFFAESLVILFLECLFLFMVWLIFFSGESCHVQDTFFYIFFLAVMIMFAGLSKRQYLPLCLINIPVVVYLVKGADKDPKYRELKLSMLILLVMASFLSIFTMFTSFKSSKLATSSQKDAIYLTNRHAIYYGVLTKSDHPEKLLQKLQLPAESKKGIGYNTWSYPKEVRHIMWDIKVPVSTVIKAFLLDPVAYIKLLYGNLGQVLQLKSMYLGSIPYATDMRPIPAATALYSSLLSSFSGHVLFYFACGFALILSIFSFGLDPVHHRILKFFLASLLICVIADVGISTLDGQQEAAKHTIASGFFICTVYALLLAAVGNLLHTKLLPRLGCFFNYESNKIPMKGENMPNSFFKNHWGFSLLLILSLLFNIVLVIQNHGYREMIAAIPETKILLNKPMMVNSISPYSNILLAEGWSFPEEWGTWSEGRQAVIKIPYSPRQPYYGCPYVNVTLDFQTHMSQRLAVSMKGKKLFSGKFSGTEGVATFRCPLKEIHASKQNSFSLQLDLPDAVAPNSVSNSLDGRVLGIGLFRIRIAAPGKDQKS